MVDIKDLTLREIEEIQNYNTRGSAGTSFTIGQAYFIRTVTMYYIGVVECITDTDMILSKASWIPDTGRFSECLSTGVVEECEPFNQNVILFRGGMIDATEWNHKLPTEVK